MNQSSFKLAVEDLGKDYPGTVALDGVSVGFAPGEVHALIGKNGAGKSTLVKILAGSVAPSRGRILCDGMPVALRAPQDAFDYGIAMVYQELSLVPGLTVAENILLGQGTKTARTHRLGGNLHPGRRCSRKAGSRHRCSGAHRRFGDSAAADRRNRQGHVL